MRYWAVVSIMIAFICSGALEQPAAAKSLLKDIVQGLKRIDRQLCSNARSAKCMAKKAKSVHKQKSKGIRAIPVVKSITAVPSATVKPTHTQQLVPPLPKARPVDLNSGKRLQPASPAIAPKPSTPVPPHPTLKPAPPVSVAPPTPVVKPAPPPVAVAPPTPVVKPAPIAVVPLKQPVSPPADDLGSACLAALAAMGTSFAPVPQPETSSACQVDTPVRLNSFATKLGVVKLPDQPIFKCDFALKLAQFVDQRMQPLALQSVGSAMVAMGTGPGFNCRGRNGDSAARMSEHAIGNAVDIETIKLANKSQVFVKDALNTQSPSFAFLRDLRAAACLDFTTVLGPGANAAHAEHFHMDLEVRRGGFRLCE